MTLDETREILSIIKAEWPQSFRGMSKRDGEARLNLWATMFADEDVRLVGAAVKALIVAGDREFAPGVGQVKEQMRKLTAPDEHTDAEAWERIRKAISNSKYESGKEFKRLPPILQKLVGSPAQLYDWALMDSDELHTVVASNIQRAYRTMKQRENETAKLPGDVQAFIAEYSARFALDSHSAANLPPTSGENREDVKSTA